MQFVSTQKCRWPPARQSQSSILGGLSITLTRMPPAAEAPTAGDTILIQGRLAPWPEAQGSVHLRHGTRSTPNNGSGNINVARRR